MTSDVRTLIGRRLRRQKLHAPDAATAAAVVSWMGAVQAQDYAGAKWALGLRTTGVTDADVEAASDRGEILRTHVLRPTWHFVAPADIKWLLALSGPRVHSANAFQYRQHELEPALLARSRKTIERALRDGTHRTRAELGTVLARVGIQADGPRLAHIVMHAELEGLVCSGPRRGRQFTYALLDERAPRAPMRRREEALAELTRRYFASHGPATLRDYVWWSGLTTRDARLGIAMLGASLEQETLLGRTCWSVPGNDRGAVRSPAAHLLPNYDEYLIAYKDRDPIASPAAERQTRDARGSDVFAHQLVLGGRLVGAWRRTARSRTVVIEARPYEPLNKPALAALAAAASRYGMFMGLPVEWRI